MMRVEVLEPGHRLDEFECTEPSLTLYLHQKAARDQARGLAQVFVLVDEDGTRAPIGYYTLNAGALTSTGIPAPLARQLKLRGLHTLPVIEIGRLAIDARFTGKGYGGALLYDAIHRAFQAPIGAVGVLVRALTDELVPFYQKLGFVQSPENPRTLFLPRVQL